MCRALTNDAVAAAEAKIGYKLPVGFLKLLRKQNGGYIRFSLPEALPNTIAGIGHHYPSLTDYCWEDCQGFVSNALQGLVPFDGDGHCRLCLDVSIWRRPRFWDFAIPISSAAGPPWRPVKSI